MAQSETALPDHCHGPFLTGQEAIDLVVEDLLKKSMGELAEEIYNEGREKRKKVLNEMCTTELVFRNNMKFILNNLKKYPMLFDEKNVPFVGDKQMAQLKPQLEKIIQNSRNYTHDISKILEGSVENHYQFLQPEKNYFKDINSFVERFSDYLNKMTELSADKLTPDLSQPGKNRHLPAPKDGKGPNLYKRFLEEFKLNHPPNIPYDLDPNPTNSATLSRCFNHRLLNKDPRKGKPYVYGGGKVDFSAMMIQAVQRGPRLDIFLKEIKKTYPDEVKIREVAERNGFTDSNSIEKITKLVDGNKNRRIRHPYFIDQAIEVIKSGNNLLNDTRKEFERKSEMKLYPGLEKLSTHYREDFFSKNTPEDFKEDYLKFEQLARSNGVDLSKLRPELKTKLLEIKNNKGKIQKFFDDLLENDPDMYLSHSTTKFSPRVAADFSNPERTPSELRADYFFWYRMASKSYNIDLASLPLKDKKVLAEISISNDKKADQFFKSIKEKHPEYSLKQENTKSSNRTFSEKTFHAGMARSNGVDIDKIPPILKERLNQIPINDSKKLNNFFSDLKKRRPEYSIEIDSGATR